jgi:hypothetical protein
LTTTPEWVNIFLLEENKLMIAYSRGSKRLAGAASLRYGVPAIVGAFSATRGYSSSEERQPFKLPAVGSIPAIQANALTCKVTTSDPGFAPARIG